MDMRHPQNVDKKNIQMTYSLTGNKYKFKIKLRGRHMKNQHQMDRTDMKHLHHVAGEDVKGQHMVDRTRLKPNTSCTGTT